MMPSRMGAMLGAAVGAALLWTSGANAQVQPLRPQGTQFVAPDGRAVRLWGVNLCSLYPTHVQADRIAADLAERGVNVVRPHHMLRASRDWVSDSDIISLVDHQATTRRFNTKALDRFDYLNARLREHGIYTMFAMRWSRTYLPQDVDILDTTPDDARAWSAAMTELNQRHWKQSIDARKLLPMIDERVALLDEEFARQLLDHTNPYTGLRYADDAQVVTVEMINEASTEYTLICGNDLPAYWQERLAAQWDAFARSHGLDEGGDLYKPATTQHAQVRAMFFDKLDRNYMQRMTATVRGTGYQGAVTFSNLWRGEMALKRHADLATYIEDHAYVDPCIVDRREDFVFSKSRSALKDKPFVLGEFNQAEGEANIAEQSSYRTMLMLAAAAYGSLQDWSGIVWFAWAHGDNNIGPDGRAVTIGRESSLGSMMRDQMMQDHLRTTSLIFREGMAATSVAPITVHVDEPLWQGNYEGLMRPKRQAKGGWASVHAVRRAFGPVSEDDADQPWFVTKPASPIVSDTGEITKDLNARTLTLIAPRAEAFSGWRSANRTVSLQHLSLEPGNGFATVIVVAADGQPLRDSRHLIVSRTALDADAQERFDLPIHLRGLRPTADGASWQITLTRPADGSDPTAAPLPIDDASTLTLPPTGWFECELHLR